ncbi:MAG: ribonuclease P protein component [Patescibacteria group bacterium]
MLPLALRLGRDQATQVLKLGRPWSGAYLSARILRSSDHLLPSRFAFVVSSKNVKRAVDRHQLKRRGRSIIINQREHLAPGYWAMIFFKASARELNFASLEKDMLNLLTATKLLIK